MSSLFRRISKSRKRLDVFKSNEDISYDPATDTEYAKKQNGAAFRTNSLGGSGGGVGVGAIAAPPWRGRASSPSGSCSDPLERKISVRANRDELVLKGILLPESPLSPPKSEPGALGSVFERLVTFLCFGEPKKDKTEGSASAQNGGGGALSPNGETPQDAAAASATKPERPSSLGHASGGGGKLTRRLLCYHSEHSAAAAAAASSSSIVDGNDAALSIGVVPAPRGRGGRVRGTASFRATRTAHSGIRDRPHPPPPMFSSPSPVPPPAQPTSGRLSPPPPPSNSNAAGGDYDYDENDEEGGCGGGDDVDEDDDDEDPSDTSDFCEHHLLHHHHHHHHQQQQQQQQQQHGGAHQQQGGGAPSSDESPPYSFRMTQPDPAIDTTRIDEIPAKSALKKKGGGPGGGSGPGTPTQEHPGGGGGGGRHRQHDLNSSFKNIRSGGKPVRFAGGSSTADNKENARPCVIREDDSDDSDSNDGPIPYREEDGGMSEERRLALKIARKESLNLKLALRPDRQELINRNILQVQSDNERQEQKEAIGARLIRRLSMRPTQEELEERNILKSRADKLILIGTNMKTCSTACDIEKDMLINKILYALYILYHYLLIVIHTQSIYTNFNKREECLPNK
nr:unnamed protein product [Callosobruchus chinensis]